MRTRFTHSLVQSGGAIWSNSITDEADLFDADRTLVSQNSYTWVLEDSMRVEFGSITTLARTLSGGMHQMDQTSTPHHMYHQASKTVTWRR